jgi:hypothetical protein
MNRVISVSCDIMVMSSNAWGHNMWIKITRSKYERAGRRYASDLADAEWRLIEPYMPAVKRLGRPREADLRAIVDAILPRCKAISTIGGTRACSSGSILNCCYRRARPLAANPVPLLASSIANRSRPPKAADHEAMMRPRKSKAVSAMS